MKKFIKKPSDLFDLHLCAIESVKPLFSHGQFKGR